jgi:hypothetical protein
VIPTIEGCGNPSHIRNVVEKIGENNQKAGKTNQVINQKPTPRLKHDKIRAPWASNIPSKSMLKRV